MDELVDGHNLSLVRGVTVSTLNLGMETFSLLKKTPFRIGKALIMLEDVINFSTGRFKPILCDIGDSALNFSDRLVMFFLETIENYVPLGAPFVNCGVFITTRVIIKPINFCSGLVHMLTQEGLIRSFDICMSHLDQYRMTITNCVTEVIRNNFFLWPFSLPVRMSLGILNIGMIRMSAYARYLNEKTTDKRQDEYKNDDLLPSIQQEYAERHTPDIQNINRLPDTYGNQQLIEESNRLELPEQETISGNAASDASETHENEKLIAISSNNPQENSRNFVSTEQLQQQLGVGILGIGDSEQQINEKEETIPETSESVGQYDALVPENQIQHMKDNAAQNVSTINGIASTATDITTDPGIEKHEEKSVPIGEQRINLPSEKESKATDRKENFHSVVDSNVILPENKNVAVDSSKGNSNLHLKKLSIDSNHDSAAPRSPNIILSLFRRNKNKSPMQSPDSVLDKNESSNKVKGVDEEYDQKISSMMDEMWQGR